MLAKRRRKLRVHRLAIEVVDALIAVIGSGRNTLRAVPLHRVPIVKTLAVVVAVERVERRPLRWRIRGAHTGEIARRVAAIHAVFRVVQEGTAAVAGGTEARAATLDEASAKRIAPEVVGARRCTAQDAAEERAATICRRLVKQRAHRHGHVGAHIVVEIDACPTLLLALKIDNGARIAGVRAAHKVAHVPGTAAGIKGVERYRVGLGDLREGVIALTRPLIGLKHIQQLAAATR